MAKLLTNWVPFSDESLSVELSANIPEQDTPAFGWKRPR